MIRLLDTSVAILLRDDAVAANRFLAALDARPVLSAITKVELEGGVYARPQMLAQRRRRLDALLRTFEVVDFNADMATNYGGIVQRVGFSRRKIIDRMIAATALSLNAVLMTTNVGDFAEIDGLEFGTWPAA
ncbi:MAG: PIN domain-containing protein [Sphingomonadaceae bacterium]